MTGERGSAAVWVLSVSALVLLAAVAVQQRTVAAYARHRAEAAADLAALAAAAGIGTSRAPCPSAELVAARNGAVVESCEVRLDASGRSGTVRVGVRDDVRLALLGRRLVHATARAERAPASAAAPAPAPATASATVSATASASVAAPARAAVAVARPRGCC